MVGVLPLGGGDRWGLRGKTLPTIAGPEGGGGAAGPGREEGALSIKGHGKDAERKDLFAAPGGEQVLSAAATLASSSY